MQNKASKQTQFTKRIAALSTAAISTLALVLTGCGTGLSGSSATGSGGPVPSVKGIHGHVHGGQNPVGFATVQLYQVGTGSSSTAATVLGSSTSSDVNGNFALTGLYTCNPNGMVYVVATGGNPGLTGGNTVNNTAISMMTGLGSCATLFANAATTYVTINELSTVATAYSLAGYMTGYANSGYQSAYPNGLTALTSAFALQNALVNTSTGYGPATPTAGIALPTIKINSLANLIAACVNTSGPTSAACSAIFTAATPSGGTKPADTIGAVLNIAHNPMLNLSSVYTTYAPTFAPFGPALTSAPSDWSMPIIYSGNALSVPYSVAIDANGNAWIANEGGNAVTEISPNATFVSGTTGYASTAIVGPQAIAVDNVGNIWLANTGANNLLELNSSSGAVSSTITTGISGPVALAFDGSDRLWVSNFDSSTLALFNNGAVVSGSPFTNTSLSAPTGIAVDLSNNLIASNSVPGGIAAFTSAGVFKSTYTDGLSVAPGGVAVDVAVTKNIYSVATGINAIDVYSSAFAASSTPLSGGGLNTPLSLAVDNAGTVWVANGSTSGTLSAFSSAGTSLFSTAGLGSLNFPTSVAIDGSGNLWTTDAGDNTVTQFVGLSVPAVTPAVANLIYY